MKTVAIAISTINRNAVVEQTIRSMLANCKEAGVKPYVIIADGSDTPVINTFEKDIYYQIYWWINDRADQRVHGPSAGRPRGKACDAALSMDVDYIWFSDDDSHINDSSYLRRLLDGLERLPEASNVTGHYFKKVPARYRDKRWKFYDFAYPQLCTGGGAVTTKKKFEQVGKIDQSLCFHEDLDWEFRARDHGLHHYRIMMPYGMYDPIPKQEDRVGGLSNFGRSKKAHWTMDWCTIVARHWRHRDELQKMNTLLNDYILKGLVYWRDPDKNAQWYKNHWHFIEQHGWVESLLDDVEKNGMISDPKKEIPKVGPEYLRKFWEVVAEVSSDSGKIVSSS